MEFLSAILGELVSRSISFMVDRYWNQPLVDDTLRRLRQLLLRSRAIVEEAEGRHLMNRGMINQLAALRDEMFRGYCVLDAFRYQALRGAENRESDQVRRTSFALSRSNQAKRSRLSSRNTPPPSRVVTVKDLQQMVHSLDEIVGDMKEFVVFLTSYPPPVHRQPYSAYLCLDKCMFGRHVEREHVIDFLLHGNPLSSHQNLEVLPIVGAALVGKSTLVEHACSDDRVRSYFSLILYYSGDQLRDETATSFRERCVTKHRNEAVVAARVLVIIELQGDVDDATWKKLSCSPPPGSKIVITSRSEKITRLGTRRTMRLETLPFEAYWYLFKVLAFGSTDPEENPKLASMAMEIATELRGCFLCAHIGGALLNANFNVPFWRKFLMFTRDYICESQDGLGGGNAHPGYGWAIAKPKPANYFVLRDSYQKKDGGPEITLVDLLSGRVRRRGRFEVLVWRSRIPPYYSYISNCAI